MNADSDDTLALLDQSWCVSTHRVNKGLVKVEAHFYIHVEKESYLLRRIEKEGKWGVLSQLEENLYLFEISVSDPNEMVPWFKSFCDKVKVLKSDDHDLPDKIEADWRVALEKYITF